MAVLGSPLSAPDCSQMRRYAPRCIARYIPSDRFGRVAPRTALSVAFALATLREWRREFARQLRAQGISGPAHRRAASARAHGHQGGERGWRSAQYPQGLDGGRRDPRSPGSAGLGVAHQAIHRNTPPGSHKSGTIAREAQTPGAPTTSAGAHSLMRRPIARSHLSRYA